MRLPHGQPDMPMTPTILFWMDVLIVLILGEAELLYSGLFARRSARTRLNKLGVIVALVRQVP